MSQAVIEELLQFSGWWLQDEEFNKAWEDLNGFKDEGKYRDMYAGVTSLSMPYISDEFYTRKMLTRASSGSIQSP